MKVRAQFPLQGSHSGIYAAPTDVAALKNAATRGGLAWLVLDLKGAASKAEFLLRCRGAFSLPETFGNNWDALADCLEDFAWLPAHGYAVWCRDGNEFAAHAPDEFSTALEILTRAATYWRSRRKIFLVLLDRSTGSAHAAPQLPGTW